MLSHILEELYFEVLLCSAHSQKNQANKSCQTRSQCSLGGINAIKAHAAGDKIYKQKQVEHFCVSLHLLYLCIKCV